MVDVREMFGALGEPLRFRILEELRRGPRFVTDLVETTGAAQPSVSRHLKALRECGMIEGERDGKWIRYRIVPGALAAIRRWAGDAAPASAPEPKAKTPGARRPKDPDDFLFT